MNHKRLLILLGICAYMYYGTVFLYHNVTPHIIRGGTTEGFLVWVLSSIFVVIFTCFGGISLYMVYGLIRGLYEWITGD